MRRYKLKVCLAGEEEVGKTSLIRRYVYNTFSESYKATIGTRVSKKEVAVEHPVTGEKSVIDMTVWDIMGTKGFRELLKDAYFYGSDAVLGVCDVTRPETLDDLQSWFDSIYRMTGPIPMCVLANKVDIAGNGSITQEQLTERCGGRYPHAFTSAKTGENVEDSFRVLCKILLAHHMSDLSYTYFENPDIIEAPFVA
jgi:small GTP-binding protein